MMSRQIDRLLIILLAALFQAGCAHGLPGTQAVASPTPTNLQTSPPPVLAPIMNQPLQPALTSDFTPCSEAPQGQTITPAAGRLLVAYSNNGLDFHHPLIAAEAVVTDGAGVPDAVILPSGRVMIYYVVGCKMENGTGRETNVIAVAVSDNQAQPGTWNFKDVQLNGLPAGYGTTIVDPNVVLLPDGSLSLLTTVFTNEEEYTAAFLSSDGGFNFEFRKIVYSDILDPENYRFNPTDWLILTGGVTGMAMSTDDGNSFLSLGVFQEREGAIHEISVTDKPGEYRAYFSSPQGITSYLSISAPWTSWNKEPGYRLQLDETTGLESCNVNFPTVVRLGPSNYVMFYLTVIPGCGCSDDPVCD